MERDRGNNERGNRDFRSRADLVPTSRPTAADRLRAQEANSRQRQRAQRSNRPRG